MPQLDWITFFQDHILFCLIILSYFSLTPLIMGTLIHKLWLRLIIIIIRLSQYNTK